MILSLFIVVYLLITMGIGLLSGRLVKTSRDFMIAGRKLSLLLCAPTMFSTWYGSETIIGASSEFLDHGLLGVIEDPFGTALCFLLIGFFIAKPIYRMNVITIVDFYRIKFGRIVEKISAIFMIVSYIGWIAAQFLAMAIIMQVIFQIPLYIGLIICSLVVCIYTISGGMWSISINDFIQTTLIIFGLLFLSAYYLFSVDQPLKIFENTPVGFFNFFPKNNWNDWCSYLTAWMTIGLGSIPQQDVFQRVMSARSEKTAIQASFTSGILYLTVGLLPLFLSLAFKYKYPELSNVPSSEVLLKGVLLQENVLIKVLFFGATLSAIMSSASGGLIAPATILEENLIRPLYPHLSDRQRLKFLRISVLISAIISLFYALSSKSVYELVAESSIISLVSLFVPLIAGIYFKKPSSTGALLSIILGPIAWGVSKRLGWEVESALIGLLFSLIGLLFGTIVDRVIIRNKYL